MLAKPLVSSKNRGALDHKLEKSRKVPKQFLEKFLSIEKIIGISIEKNIRRKMRILNSLIVPKKVKRGPFWLFENPICCGISKKLKGGPFGDLIQVSHSRKNLKGGTI